jgi:hypothetical protein
MPESLTSADPEPPTLALTLAAAVEVRSESLPAYAVPRLKIAAIAARDPTRLSI